VDYYKLAEEEMQAVKNYIDNECAATTEDFLNKFAKNNK
jgi:hypothetical protein